MIIEDTMQCAWCGQDVVVTWWLGRTESPAPDEVLCDLCAALNIDLWSLPN